MNNKDQKIEEWQPQFQKCKGGFKIVGKIPSQLGGQDIYIPTRQDRINGPNIYKKRNKRKK